MSEEHERQIRYTVHTVDRHWWGGRIKHVFYGVSSSLKDGELLIFAANGTFYSINYSRVRWMSAEPLHGSHA